MCSTDYYCIFINGRLSLTLSDETSFLHQGSIINLAFDKVVVG